MATALILDELNNKTERVFPIEYSLVKIEDIAINTQAIGLGNTPAIPLQVIGYSNYIL